SSFSFFYKKSTVGGILFIPHFSKRPEIYFTISLKSAILEEIPIGDPLSLLFSVFSKKRMENKTKIN
ncbi:MAG: hypothetical protein ACI4TG_04700, partial [Ruminococcus sp.]